ncbi:MAG: response regulator transcription factor [Eubacteriales bacterium]|nr:response regulator transcription factor [Eubacteriales bacterium]
MDQQALILICDDDKVIHESLSIYLENEHFAHRSAYDGEAALALARELEPDLILLDIMMPKMSGTDVCREIRKTSRVPIIMLTAKGEEIDRVLGLELGADDYIVKPFSPRELVARIKAVLRRANEPEKPGQTVRYEGLEVNLDTYQVSVDGVDVPFTAKEVEILFLLASNPNQVFDRQTILSKIWGYEYFGDMRTVDTHIKRIRQKLQSDKHSYSVVTIYGAGYKFDPGK